VTRSATWMQSVGGDQTHLPVLDVEEEWAVVESPECEPEAETDATGFPRPQHIPRRFGPGTLESSVGTGRFVSR